MLWRLRLSHQLPNFVVRLREAHAGMPALPARLDDAWDLTLQRQSTEAQTADAELAQERTRAPAQLAAVVLAALELGLTSVFYSLCSR